MTKRHAFSVVLLFSIVVLAVTIGVAIAAQQPESPSVALSTNEEVLVNPEEAPPLDGMVEGETVNATELVMPVIENVNADGNVNAVFAVVQNANTNVAVSTAKAPVKKNTNVAKPTNTTVNTNTAPVPTPSTDLSDPYKKDIAMQLVSSAENSSLNWKAQ